MSASDTPRTDAVFVAVNDPTDRAHKLRLLSETLERENAELRARIERLHSYGTVYVYPRDWSYRKMREHPPIDAYDEVDLTSI